jgi:hypothetical protein
MKRSSLILALCALTGSFSVAASPLDDLGSSSSEVRARAAQMIRDNHLYRPTLRAPWDELAQSFRKGEEGGDFLKSLQEKGACLLVTPDDFKPGHLPPSAVMTLPLDDSWSVESVFANYQLLAWKLIERPKEIFVPPPAGYTGRWRTYRINGEGISHYYLRGLYVGPPE